MPSVKYKWRPIVANDPNPVHAAREAVCAKIGVNIYARTSLFVQFAEQGQYEHARRELLDLLRFFPKGASK